MKKDEKKKHPRGSVRGVVHDWKPLFARLQDTIDWALDLAAKLARGYEEDIEAIERVRGYVRAWFAGNKIDIEVGDVLTTLAILFAAIELDLSIDSQPLFTPLRDLPPVMPLPGAKRVEVPTVVIRRSPRRRNACCGFTQIAA